jgi:predicted small secreted protein
MKIVAIVFLAVGIQACSTIGRTVQGVGEDVKRGTDYISDMILPDGSRR